MKFRVSIHHLIEASFGYYDLTIIGITASSNSLVGSLLLNLPNSGYRISICEWIMSFSIYLKYLYPSISYGVYPGIIDNRISCEQNHSGNPLISSHNIKDSKYY